MRFGDRARGPQPKPRAVHRLPRRHERFERTIDRINGDARPFVDDTHADRRVVGIELDENLTAAAGQRLLGIDDQIQERLLQLRAVPLHVVLLRLRRLNAARQAGTLDGKRAQRQRMFGDFS